MPSPGAPVWSTVLQSTPRLGSVVATHAEYLPFDDGAIMHNPTNGVGTPRWASRNDHYVRLDRGRGPRGYAGRLRLTPRPLGPGGPRQTPTPLSLESYSPEKFGIGEKMAHFEKPRFMLPELPSPGGPLVNRREPDVPIRRPPGRSHRTGSRAPTAPDAHTCVLSAFGIFGRPKVE